MLALDERSRVLYYFRTLLGAGLTFETALSSNTTSQVEPVPSVPPGCVTTKIEPTRIDEPATVFGTVSTTRRMHGGHLWAGGGVPSSSFASSSLTGKCKTIDLDN
jgi:hypothetical protein